MESHKRSIAKALSWRLLGSTATFALAWVATRQVQTAALIGMGDVLLKVGAFYVHERAWERINFGRLRAEEQDASLEHRA